MGADDSTLVMGTCDGTGAAINVCLGFIPSKVEIWNVEDAGSLLPKVEWINMFKMVTTLDEGVLETGLSDTDYDRTVLTTGGISEYAGGDELTYEAANSRWNNAAGASVEEVYVDGAYELLHASNPAYRCIGDSIAGKPAYDNANALLGGVNPYDGAKVKSIEGFTIGTNANLNADGERLIWIAHR